MEETAEVKLLSYRFIFKKMRWREHAAIKFEKGKDPQRIILAHALLEVAGIKPKNVAESMRVMDAVPAAIVERVFKIWRAAFPPARKFTTSKLYCAPEPSQYDKQIVREEDEETAVHDRTMREMESKFGPQEIAETKNLERQILSAAQRKDGGFRGAVVATEDKHGQ
jgi:ribonuclease D